MMTEYRSLNNGLLSQEALRAGTRCERQCRAPDKRRQPALHQFRNDVTKFVVISMKTEKITPQYRIILNSLQCYLPKPDQSHMDVLWEPSVPFRGNYMGPLIIPNGNERSLSKYQIAGFQVPGREETSTTIGAASFHHCIAEVVCGVHPWMLAR